MRYQEHDYYSDAFAIQSTKPENKKYSKFRMAPVDEKDIKAKVSRKAFIKHNVDPYPINHPNIDRFLRHSHNPQNRNYVSLFLAQDGLNSVKRAINHDFTIPEIKKMMEEEYTENKHIRLAAGRIFEHMAQLWIADSMNKKNTTIVDPINTNNLFSLLNTISNTNVFPDGVMLQHETNHVMIQHLFEYKMNPEYTAEHLDTQIERAKNFFNKFKDKRIYFDFNTVIDKRKNIKAASVGLGERPQFFVVIPFNRSFEKNEPDVHIVRSPFTTGFIGGLSQVAIEDIILNSSENGIGDPLNSSFTVAGSEEDDALRYFNGK